MRPMAAPKWVVVGIDGSQAAINAAVWAVAESIDRDIPLRLVYVLEEALLAEVEQEDVGLQFEYGDAALRCAAAAARAADGRVNAETVVLPGHRDEVLIDESRDAELICLGATGVGDRTAQPPRLGTVARTVTECAHCPVAIIADDTQQVPKADSCIAVVLKDEPDKDDVVHAAMQEARLRKLPVLMIDRRLDSWVRRYPDVHVEIVATLEYAASYHECTCGRIQLAVVGRADADHIAELLGPDGNPIVASAGCSILAVRH